MDALDVRRREYKRQRDARVALIRCAECKEYYETSVRQARRICNGEHRRLCPTCRSVESAKGCTPDQAEKYAEWWLSGESGLSRGEAIEIANLIHPGAVRESEPVLSPSRRLPNEEGNRPTPLHVLAGASLRFSVSVTSSTAA